MAARKQKPTVLLLADYPVSTKKEVAENLKSEGYKNIRYSGKQKGFYATK